MRSIGGYFSLELPCQTWGEKYPNGIKLNAGRYALEYILKAKGYKKLWIPYYCCDTVLQPVQSLGIDYEFYHINKNLEIAEKVSVGKDEALLYVDYFGLKGTYADYGVAYDYGSNVIIDKTQAFYDIPKEGVDTFYSCRKFFGVSDGAYLFTDKPLDEDLPFDHSSERLRAQLDRIDLSPEEAFNEYHKSEENLDCVGIHRMSKLTQAMMNTIDYWKVACQRMRNYQYLNRYLEESNGIHLNFTCDTVPMVYPYYCTKAGLRNHLIKNHIYVAKYWPNVEEWTGKDKDSVEADLAEHLIPLPIDERYGEEEMKFIIETIRNYGK